jgi:integrase-like protein
MLTLAYGCGLRAGEVVRLRAGDIDSAQMIIRIVQSKGRKDRNVMLPAEVLDLSHAGQDRHLMSQTSNRPRSCLFPIGWLRAGSDPARSDHGLQCTECPLVHSEPALRCPSPARAGARASTRGPHPPCVTFTAALGARIKDAMRRTKDRLSPFALSFVPS